MTSAEQNVLSAILSYYDNTYEAGKSAVQKTAQSRENVRALLTRISQPAQCASGSSGGVILQSNKRQRSDTSHTFTDDAQSAPRVEERECTKESSSEIDSTHKFIMILEQTRVPHEPAARGCILFLRYSAESRDFCGRLLEAIGDERPKYRFLVAPKFVNRSVASLFESAIAETLGLIACVYDNCDLYKWDIDLWNRCEHSPNRFLQVQTTADATSATCIANTRMERDFVRDELAKRRLQHLCNVAERYSLDMQQFLLWLADSLESMRVQLLPHYSYRVFMHLYLDLVWLENNASDASLSRQFYDRFVHHFEHRRDFASSLCELRKVTTRDLMVENEFVCNLRGLHPNSVDADTNNRSQKFILRVSRDCYRFLQHAMRMDLINRSVQTVTRSFIEFQVAS